MYIKKILFILFVLCISQSHESQIEHDFISLFQGCRKQLIEWVGFQQTSHQLIQKCNIKQNTQSDVLKIYKQLTQAGLDFELKHFDIIRKYLKQNQLFAQVFKCLIQSRNTQNEYFNQKKKFKYFGQFIRQHPKQGKFLFVQQQKMWQEKGKKFCNYLKAFFQHYYLNVLKPSETLSTTFLRALTVRTNIFQHEDVAYCVDLETHGNLVQNLQGLQINNIYVRIPEIFNAIKFLKFKKQCQSQKYINMMKNTKQRLKDLDMFKIMYNDYQPFVQIAAQKFGTSQLKLLARKFSDIINYPQEYKQLSQKEL